MISLKTSNNIFYNRRVTLDYLNSSYFESGGEFEEINWLELRIAGQANQETFEHFIATFFLLLKKDFLIDLICYERSEKVKNRLRSYSKLFYELRKGNFIDNKFIIEEELDSNENHSLLTGILQINEVDNEIIFNEIFNTYFKFGHAELNKKKSDKSLTRLEKLKKHLDFKLLQRGKLVELDYLILLDRFVTPTSMVFSHRYDGKDDLVFTVYSGNEIVNRVEEMIQKSLPFGTKLKKIKANSKEIDRLINSYFKDWKRA